MSVTNINSVSATATGAEQAARIPAKVLDQNDFLKLLVAQMTSQDPMNPQSNADFAAQMAQFSALQTSRDTQTEIARLREDQQVGQASLLLGRTVSAIGEDGTVVTGPVEGIRLESGRPQLLVNGTLCDPAAVLTISSPTTN